MLRLERIPSTCWMFVRESESRLFSVDIRKIKTFYSKKYGISHPRFTHRANNIIHASTKEDDGIRYHSMHENTYISYFKGHTARWVAARLR